MPSKPPQPNGPTPPLARARALLSLTLALGVLCLGAAAAQTLDPASAQPPRVRPRTVGPKPEAAPQPTPAEPVAAESPETVGEDEVVRVESNLVLIPASVVDTRGRAVTDLRLEDFELKVDGETKLINDLSRAETPVHIALLFDNSQSLSSAREFEKQAALRFFRTVIRPIDRAAIYSFASAPKLELPFTNNVAGLARTIEKFGAPDGATALFEAIAQAADYIAPVPGRKVIVLVSDGADTVSDINFDEALNRTLRAECQIYVVQTRQLEEPNLHDSFSEQLMLKLTEQTGGAVFVPRTVEDLDTAFAQISLDLSQQYVLSYNPQSERRDNNFRFINLSIKSRPQFRVRARKGFYPDGLNAGTAPPDAPPASARVPAPRPGASPEPAASMGRNRGARGKNTTPRAAARTNPAGRVGPASPDEDERPRPPQPAPQYVEEPKQTMTLTVAESTSAAASRSLPEAAPTTTPTPAARPTPQEAAAATPPAAPEKSEAAKRGPVSGGVLNGKALTLPRPSYPVVAKSAGVTGTVVVEVTIDERGNVAHVRVLSGPTMLQQAALSAARQAKFSPTILSGEPVRVTGTINYTFSKP